MPSGIVINISGSGEGAAEALRQIEARMQETAEHGRQMSSQLTEASERIGASFEHTVPRVAAASGAIREFEGTLPIRAVERFLTDTLHLGPALQAAFPLIGAIAFGEMLVHIGQEIGKVMDGSNAAAENIRKEWEKANESLAASSDALDMKIDKTIEETDKLLHHSGENHLKVMFDEARESAEKLGISIGVDLDKFEELLNKKENNIGFWGSALTGNATTSNSQSVMKSAHDSIMKTVEEYGSVVQRAGESGNKENLDQAQVARLAALERAYEDATNKISKSLREAESAQDSYEASGKMFGKDQTANINLLSGALRNLAEQQRNIGTQYAESLAAQSKTGVGDGGTKAAEAALKDAEERERLSRETDTWTKEQLAMYATVNAAKLRIQEAFNASDLANAKSAASAQEAALEASYKAGEMSHIDYIERRLKLSQAANDQEQEATRQKASELTAAGASNVDGAAAKQLDLYAKLIEVNMKLNELATDREKLEALATGEINAQVQLQKAQQRDAEKQRYTDVLSVGNQIENANKSKDKKTANTLANGFTGMVDEIGSSALKGKMSVKQMADSVIADLERMALKVIEERWIGPAMQSMFGLGAPTSFQGATPSLDTIDNSITDTIPMDAGGGDVAGGGMAIVGDGGDGSGSELFAPKGPGTVLPHDVLEGIAKGGQGGSGAPNVSVVNVNNSSSPVTMKQTGVSWDSGARQFIIKTVLEDMQQGGPTSMAMRSGG